MTRQSSLLASLGILASACFANSSEHLLTDDASEAQSSSTSTTPSIVEGPVADIDGDGTLDVLAGDSWFANVDGNGNFVRHPLPGVAATSQVVAADIDGDGDLDLISTDGLMFHNLGNAEMSAGVPFGDGSVIQRLRLVELAGHATPAVVAVANDTVTVFVHTVQGLDPFAELSTSSVAFDDVGDLNSDGHIDAVSHDHGGIHIHLNQGGATSDVVLSTASIWGPNSDFVTALAGARIVDIDNDGDADIAVDYVWSHPSDHQPFNSSAVLVNDGTATFSSRINIPAGTTFQHVDENRGIDGWATVSHGYFTTLEVVTPSSDGTWSSPQWVTEDEVTCGVTCQARAIADLNGDGVFDALLDEPPQPSGPIWFDGAKQRIHAPGDAPLTPAAFKLSFIDRALVDVPSHGQFTFADVNGDSVPDYIGAGPSGGAGWGPAADKLVPISLAGERFVGTGDLNDDGAVDVIVAQRSLPGGKPQSALAAYLNDGSGTFTRLALGQVSGAWVSTAIVGDVDDDGDADLLLASEGFADRLDVMMQDSNLFVANKLSPGNAPRFAQLVDVDGDGDLDVLGQEPTGGSDAGPVIFEFEQDNFTRLGPAALDEFVFQDLDGNGDDDVLRAGINGQAFGWSAKWQSADIDNDGRRDIVTTEGTRVLWYQAEGQDFEAPRLMNIYPGLNSALNPAVSRPLSLTDVDGDGDVDVLFGRLFLESRTTGDSNNDGAFDSADLVQVQGAGKYEDDVPRNATYEEGDWNQDGDFTSADYVFVFQAGTYE